MTSKVFTQLEEVTPTRASAWLADQINNRPVNQAHVNRLAGEIRRGDWRVNGDSVKIDTSGRMVDGQHRMAAIISAGMPVMTFVTYGVTQDVVINTVDQGKSRTGAQSLTMTGVKEGSIKSAICRSVLLLECGVTMTAAFSNAQIRSTYERLAEPIDMVTQIRRVVRAPSAAVLVLSASIVDLPEVVELLKTGAGLTVGDPLLIFRNWSMGLVGANHVLPVETIGKAVTMIDARKKNEPLSKLLVSTARYRDWCSYTGLPVSQPILSGLQNVSGKF